jgi:TP901 family phage tail tape measure protein
MKDILQAALVLSAVDKASRVIRQVADNATKSLTDIQKKADSIAKSAFDFGKQSMGVGLATAAMLAGPTVMAADFQKEMGNVATLIDTTSESMLQMGEDVLAVSKRVPVGLSDLTAALYDVRSAGIPAAQAMDVLERSAQLSVSGLSTTAEATNIMTSAMNAFQSEGLTAAQTADLIFKTVKAGKTTVSQLAQAFGATAPIVQNAGIRLADFQAATAALTTVGIPASQAQQQLRQSIVSIIKPTADMQKLFHRLGVKDGRQLIATSENMGEVFAKLRYASERSGISLEKAAGSVESLNAILSITDATNAAYTSTLADMTGGVNQMDEAFQKQLSNAHQQFQLVKNQGRALAITIGNVLLPRLLEIGRQVMPIIETIAAWIGENQKLTEGIILAVAAFAGITVAIGAASFAFGGVFKAISLVAKVAAVVPKLISGLTFFFFRLRYALFIVRGAFMKLIPAIYSFTAALLANPMTWIVVGIVAAGAAIYALVTRWEEFTAWFRRQPAIIKAIVGLVLSPIIAIAAIIRGVMKLVKGEWKISWDDIKNVVSQFDIISIITEKLGQLWDAVSAFGGRMFEAGKNLAHSIADGIKAGAIEMVNSIKDAVSSVRDYLPFSPAKVGPLKDIHRIKLVETIAQSVKPAPLVNAMRTTALAAAAVLPMAATGASGGQSAPSQRLNINPPATTGQTINYSPVITFGGNMTPEEKESFIAMLRKHKDELARLVNDTNQRKNRTSF